MSITIENVTLHHRHFSTASVTANILSPIASIDTNSMTSNLLCGKTWFTFTANLTVDQDNISRDMHNSLKVRNATHFQFQFIFLT
ncbi:hypothetical protein E2C01_020948 [Portunus trituberculatus]|uniref:Uncharacterized protein n=1 Tax=Portunus trituberculatus TaxID=210409 RepID=A0A5B7E1Y9_PORTR|nr:hypothetical protein [Portunus trituberculatus]